MRIRLNGTGSLPCVTTGFGISREGYRALVWHYSVGLVTS
jgi:hypothetical protein